MTDEPLNAVFVSSVQFTSSEQQIRLSCERQLVRLKAQRLFGTEKENKLWPSSCFLNVQLNSLWLWTFLLPCFKHSLISSLKITKLSFHWHLWYFIKINLIKPYLPTLEGMAEYEKVFIMSCNNKIWSARVNALQPPWSRSNCIMRDKCTVYLSAGINFWATAIDYKTFSFVVVWLLSLGKWWQMSRNLLYFWDNRKKAMPANLLLLISYSFKTNRSKQISCCLNPATLLLHTY